MAINLKYNIKINVILTNISLLFLFAFTCNLSWADEGLYQIVTLNVSQTYLSSGEDITVNTNTGSTFTIFAYYNVSNNYSQLSGVGIRIHYDSSKLEFYYDVYSNGLIATPFIDDDIKAYSYGGYDYYENTDKILQIAWCDLANQNWPGTTLPVQLIMLVFKVKNDYSEGNTNINVSFNANAVGYEGLSNKAVVSLGGKPTVSWSELSQTKKESDGNVSITAILDSSYFEDILIDYVVSGTAQTGGEDISLNSTGTLIIPEGQQSGILNFTINDDSNYEKDETAIITMQSVSNAEIGSNNSHTLTITDNDNIPNVNFSSSSNDVYEIASETSAFTIVLSGTSYEDISVSYSVKGKSTEEDKVITNGEITINAGQLMAIKTFNDINVNSLNSYEKILITIDSVENASKGSLSSYTINIINKPPSFKAGGVIECNEDCGKITINPWANEISEGSGNKDIEFITTQKNIFQSLKFDEKPAISFENGALTFIPASNKYGRATYEVYIKYNENINTESQNLTIIVNPVNDKPTFEIDDTLIEKEEDCGPISIESWAKNISTGANEDNQGYTFTLSKIAGNQLEFETEPSISEYGTLSFEPKENSYGTTSYTVCLYDDGGTYNNGINKSDVKQLTITVEAVNDAPVAYSMTVIIHENEPKELTLKAEDIDNDSITFHRSDTPNSEDYTLSIKNSNGFSQFGCNEYKDYTFNFFVRDEENATSNDAMITIRYIPLYNPSINLINSYLTGFEDIPITINLNIKDREEEFLENKQLTFSVNSSNEKLFNNNEIKIIELLSNKETEENSNNITINYSKDENEVLIDKKYMIKCTPQPEESGKATIILTVNDPENNTFVTSLNINIKQINDSPVFEPGDEITIDEVSESKTFTYTWAESIKSGPDNEKDQMLKFIIQKEPSSDDLFLSEPSISDNGILSFTTKKHVNGTASYTVTLKDDGGIDNNGMDQSNPEHLTIIINEINSPPSFKSENSSITVDEDCEEQTIQGWAKNISAGENESQTVWFNVSCESYSYTPLFLKYPELSDKGTLSFMPYTNANGKAIFKIILEDDGKAYSDPKYLTIVIKSINDPPYFELSNTDITILEDSGCTKFTNFVNNISPGADNEPYTNLTFNLSIDANAVSLYEEITISPSGDLTITTKSNMCGSITVTVKLKDSTEYSEKNIKINIIPVNDCPNFKITNENKNIAVSSFIGKITKVDFVTEIWAEPEKDCDQDQNYSFTVSTESPDENLFIQQPTIDNDGNLVFEPEYGITGTTVLKVTMNDNGLTENEGCNSYSDSFTITFYRITCNISNLNDNNSIKVYESIEVNGEIIPELPQGGKLKIILQKGDKEIEIKNLTEFISSRYSTNFDCKAVDEPGKWNVQAKWIDNNNIERIISEVKSFSATKSEIKIDNLDKIIAENGKEFTINVNIDGISCDGINLNEIPMQMTVTLCEQSKTYSPVIKDSGFQFQFEIDNNCIQKSGTALISLLTNDKYEMSSKEIEIKVIDSTGYAFIAQGASESCDDSLEFSKTVNLAKDKLASCGVENITEYTGAEMNTLENRFIDFTEKINAMNPGNIYLIFIDHGSEDKFSLIDYKSLSSEKLNNWIEKLEGTITDKNNDYFTYNKIIVILGFCKSGSFIDELSKNNRIIITSSGVKEDSYKGPLINDEREGEFFISEFFKSLSYGKSVKKCFQQAVIFTEWFTTNGLYKMNNVPFFDGARQHPLLDDNGDGKGSNTLCYSNSIDNYTRCDGIISEDVFIGKSPENNTNSTIGIKKVNGPIVLSNDETSAELWAEIEGLDKNSIWVKIKEINNNNDDSEGQQTIAFQDGKKNDKTNDDNPNIVYFTYNDFKSPGTYQIYFFASKDGEVLLNFKTSIVYKKSTSANSEPSAITLISPNNKITIDEMPIILNWDHITIQDNDDKFSYTVLLSENNNLNYTDNSIISGLNKSFVILNSDHISNNKTYYWQVIAFDEYGFIIAESQLFSFTTSFDKCVEYCYIVGKIFNANDEPIISNLKNLYIIDENENENKNTINVNKNGEYFSQLFCDQSYNLTVKDERYNPKSIEIFIPSDENTIELNINLTPNNQKPEIVTIKNQATDEDTAITISFNVDDADNDQLVITGNSTNQTLVPDENLTFSGSGKNRLLTITPANNEYSDTEITINVCDGQLTSTTQFPLIVNSINDEPTISEISNQKTNEDTSITITFTIDDVDNDINDLIITGNSTNKKIVPDENLTFSGSGTNRTLTITPASNEYSDTEITINVCDGQLTSTTQFTLNVIPINDSPSFEITNYTFQYDEIGSLTKRYIKSWAYSISAGVNEEDPKLEFIFFEPTDNNKLIFNSPPKATINKETADLFFTPERNSYGNASYIVNLKDSYNGESDPKQITIIVNPKNNKPTFELVEGVKEINVAEDCGLTGINFAYRISAGPYEDDQDVEFIFERTDNNKLKFNILPGAEIDKKENSASLFFSPEENSYGEASFKVILKDDQKFKNESIPQYITIIVKPVNDPPNISKIQDYSLFHYEDFVVDFDLYDPDNEASDLTISAISTNQDFIADNHIKVNVDGNKKKLLINNMIKESGTTSIILTVSDPEGLSNSTQFNFKVDYVFINDLNKNGNIDLTDVIIGLQILSDVNNDFNNNSNVEIKTGLPEILSNFRFCASDIVTGDLDKNRFIDLRDVILALKALTGRKIIHIDPNSALFDQKIKLNEVIFILNKISKLDK